MSHQDIIVLAEVHQQKLADITFELLAAARQLADATGGQVVAVALSDAGAGYADALGAADRVMVIDDAQLADFTPEPFLTVLKVVVEAEAPRAVLLGSTTIGYDLASPLAAQLEAPIVNACQNVQVDGEALQVTASLYAGKMLTDVTVAGSPAILLILPGAFKAVAQSGQAQVETSGSPVPLSSGAVVFEQMILPEAGDVDITQQDVLVAVGRGIQQEDDLELAEELAAALGGVVCASRPVVDQGWLPATRQVGKSGMIVSPKCYLALGISGAPEHQEGMQGSAMIIAVNTDPTAPIFDIAQYGVEADLFDLVPELTEALTHTQGVG